MLTFRFERDVDDAPIASPGDKHGLTEAKSYICYHRGDHHELILKHGDGDREVFIVGCPEAVLDVDPDHMWDRCYVMNAMGSTVARITAPRLPQELRAA